MADTKPMLPLQHHEQQACKGVSTNRGQDSILDDFNYSTNVAGSSKYIRLGFLRKVYGILSVQLLCTTLISATVLSSQTLTYFVRDNPAVVMISAIVSFVLIFALMVKSKETPLNYILLSFFTIAESLLVATAVTCYDVSSVVEAFVLTFAVTLSLTFYTFQTKRDMTSWGAGLFACLWVLIISGFLQIFMQSILMERVIATGGALLFSAFIVYDTHMIMHKVSPEDYIHASITLYLDILNLFLHLLRLLGDRR